MMHERPLANRAARRNTQLAAMLCVLSALFAPGG